MSDSGKNYLPLIELKEVFVTHKDLADSMDKVNINLEGINTKLDNHLTHYGEELSIMRKDVDALKLREENVIISKSHIKRDIGTAILALLGGGTLFELIKLALGIH